MSRFVFFEMLSKGRMIRASQNKYLTMSAAAEKERHGLYQSVWDVRTEVPRSGE